MSTVMRTATVGMALACLAWTVGCGTEVHVEGGRVDGAVVQAAPGQEGEPLVRPGEPEPQEPPVSQENNPPAPAEPEAGEPIIEGDPTPPPAGDRTHGRAQ